MSTPAPLRDQNVTFAVLFMHPTECYLDNFHAERARFLELKYGKATYVMRDGEMAVVTRLAPAHGRPIVRTITGLPREPDTLINALASSIDERYSEVIEANEQERPALEERSRHHA